MAMELDVTGEVWNWRGPSPYRVGGTTFSTSLFPKDGGYVVPLKDAVRRAEGIELGDTVTVRLTVDHRPLRPRRR